MPRATLTLKAYDPESGVVLKFKTDRTAEVGRLVNGLGRVGRQMAALPEKEESMAWLLRLPNGVLLTGFQRKIAKWKTWSERKGLQKSRRKTPCLLRVAPNLSPNLNKLAAAARKRRRTRNEPAPLWMTRSASIAVQGVIVAGCRVSSRGPPALTFTLPYPQYDRRPGRPHPVEIVHSKPSSA